MINPVLLKLESYVALTDEDRALVNEVVATADNIEARIDIIREGEHSKHAYLITQGFACQYKILANGQRQIVAILLPGDFCDLGAYVFDRADHSIATLTPSVVAAITTETIAKLMGRPSIAKALSMTALVEVAILREWIANLGGRSAEQRVAHLFCELYARMRAVGLAANDGTATLPISQVDIGEALGLSVVHTNRSIKKLKEQGLLTYKSKKLSLLKQKLLEEMCGFTANYLRLSEKRER